MYKMIAVDMDGTLLRNDKTISKETIRAIKLAKSRGVKIVLATGRPLDGVRKYLKELELISEDEFVITFNGVLIQNTATEDIISRKTLNFDDLNYLYNIGIRLNIDMHVFTNYGLLTPKMNKYTAVECAINEIEAKITDFEVLDSKTEVIKFMMVGEKPKLDETFEKLPGEVFNKYTVVRSAPYFLEFLNKECNKGEGVITLADHLKLNIEDIICIGDAGNDYHMIKYAGLGVAMENAFPEVKEIADFVTKSNEADGVAHVIEKFILAG